jgi:hypothetical protein
MKTQTENKLVREAEAAWEIYHGKTEDDYIPAMPPAFKRGYLDGAQAANARLRDALERIEEIFVDGSDTYDDWYAMGRIATAALTKEDGE